jgi:hypothetical protein
MRWKKIYNGDRLYGESLWRFERERIQRKEMRQREEGVRSSIGQKAMEGRNGRLPRGLKVKMTNLSGSRPISWLRVSP